MSFGTTKTKITEAPPINLTDIFKPSVSLEVVPALHMAIYGRAKTGKSWFSLTAKPPLYIIDTEGSIKINIKSFPEEIRSQIFIAEVLLAADKVNRKVDLTKSLAALTEAIDIITSHAMTQDTIGTIVIDSATDIWDWLGIWLEDGLGKGEGDRINRLEWGKANKRYTQMMYMLLRSNWNVIMTFRAAPAVDNKGSDLGFDKARWQKNSDYWFDLITEITREGSDHIIQTVGGRFGDEILEFTNASWTEVRDKISKQSGVKFA